MKNRIKQERRAAELIALLQDDTVDPATKERIRAWFWSDVSRRAKEAALMELFQGLSPNPAPDERDRRRLAELAAQLHIDGLKSPLRPVRKASRLFSHPLRFAASVALLVGLSTAVWLWVDRAGNAADQPVTVVARYEGQALSLPDGSTVTLGRQARISYDPDFAANRLVTLTGEAKFEVAKIENATGGRQPFTVRANDHQIHVLGTVFRVDAPQGAADSRIALYEGAVNVQSPDKTIELRPGEEYFRDATGHAVTLIPAQEMLRQGFTPVLRFDRSSLANLMLALEANFEVRFVLPSGIDPASGGISADFEGLALSEIVHLLSLTDKQYAYRLNENTITLTTKKITLDD